MVLQIFLMIHRTDPRRSKLPAWKKTSISQNEMKVGELLLYHVENKIIGLLQKKFLKEEIETLQEDEWKKSYILGNKKSTEVQHLPSIAVYLRVVVYRGN